ncbi:MAG: ABC transporter permease [Caldilineaceae bacterium]|nr:ABC transporter permease [Caldilineaceae bacterium]
MIQNTSVGRPEPLSTATAERFQSLSRTPSAWQVMISTVIKDLQIARRYLPNLLGTFIELAIRLAFFFLLASVISMDGRRDLGVDLQGRNMFIFFQGALLLFIFIRATLGGPLDAITNDLYNGTLEFLYSNPASRYAYYVGTVVAKVLVSSVVFLPLYLFLVIYAQASLTSVLMVLLASLVVLVTLTAMGIMIALLALIWRQVGALVAVLSILFEMLSGAYVPITAYPPAAQKIAYLLPYTWGYDLIRYYSFDGHWQPLLPIAQEWLILCTFAVVFTLLSRYLLARAEAQAKRIGLHVI